MGVPQRFVDSPLLLVSVRDADEALAALAGGCDILDVKEPLRGSLGMADVDSIANVIVAARKLDARQRVAGVEPQASPRKIPISAALGEVSDWLNPKSLPVLPAGLDYAKLGLAGMKGHRDWPALWRKVRERFNAVAAQPVAWVAVAYADWERAGAPHPESIIEQASETGCAFVLFDTWNKSGGTLLDSVTPEALSTWIDQIHRYEMRCALAGRLSIAMLPEILPLRPDVVAVRGAACVESDRTARVSEEAVREIRQALRNAAQDQARKSMVRRPASLPAG